MEIRVTIPDGCRLIGVRTECDDVIIVCESPKQVRQIGFIQTPPEPQSEENNNNDAIQK